jgi:chromate reductase
LAASDAVLFVTPEYNYGVPGVLKNALDWASRPPTTTPLHGMPAGIMGAATGMIGTARAQLQLRQALVYTHTYPLAAPEVLVARAQDKFDASGKLHDEPTRKFVADYMESLRLWTIRLRRPAE